MLKRAVLPLFALLALAGLPLRAQEPPANPVTWALARKSAAPVKVGEVFTVDLVATIKDGWHLYSTTQPPGGPIATRITVAPGQPFSSAAPVNVPAPKVAFDPNFNLDTHFYADRAVFGVSVKVDEAPPGAATLQVNAYYQTCNDTFCMPPKTVPVKMAVTIAPGRAAASTVAASGPPVQSLKPDPSIPQSQSQTGLAPPIVPEPRTQSPEPQQGAARGGAPLVLPSTFHPSTSAPTSIWSFLWLAATVGALSLLTPCVFPMVPITVSYFTRHASGNRRTAVAHASVYVLGIVLTFTALGLALAIFVGAAGLNQFAANPWINLLITAVFLGFALNLFGAYEIRVPSAALSKLDGLTRREGGSAMLGTLLMGLTFTLTSFTCTAPFVGSLLVMASQGDWQWPVAGMIAFSSVFALPFFVLALVPQWLTQLPRAGSWLNSVKVSMGFLEVAAAMKFISNVDLVWKWEIFTREVVLASWVAVAVLLTLYLIGVFRLTNDGPVDRIGPWRLASAILCLAVTFHLLTGLYGRRLGELEAFLPPATDGGASASGTLTGELPWILNDYEGALAAAKRENKLVLIDFTGYTCTNCRWMEANMFPRADVRRELERYVRVRLYTDGDGDMYRGFQSFQQERFGTVALPYYAVVTRDGEPLVSFPGLTRKPPEFISFLQRPFAPAVASTGSAP